MRMNRLLPLALLTALLVAAPAAHAARGFSFGVTAGDVTASSAVLWGKANKGGKYTLDGRPQPPLHAREGAQRVRARKGHDNTVQMRVKRPAAGQALLVPLRRERGRRSDVGTFMTAPKPSQNKTIEFAWSGDQDFNPEPGQTQPVLERRRRAAAR